MENAIASDLILRALAYASTARRDSTMTFLVGLVGSDGVVLASDMKHTRNDEVRSTFNVEKIFLSTDGKLAYCASGDEIANTVGQHLLQTLRSEGPHDFEQALRTQIQEKVSAQLMSTFDNQGSILLGRFAPNGVQIWKIVVHNQSTLRPNIFHIRNRVCEGDKANSASFIGETYFPKTALPIKRLRLLAAHAVLMAGKNNPQYIDGLDMAESAEAGFRKLNSEELMELTSLSKTLDDYTSAALTGAPAGS